MNALHESRLTAAQASGGTSAEAIYAAVLRTVLACPASNTILDFGAGTGNLTARLYESGSFHYITGTDILPRPPRLPENIAWIQQDLNEPVPLPSHSFDLICASEVIEHLENPRAVAREWYRLLRVGGHLVISTPNNESLRSLLTLVFRGHFNAFTDSCYPAQITALVRKDIQRVLTEAGFGGIGFHYIDVGAIPKLTHLNWQNLSARLFRGLRYSDNLLAVAQKA